MAGWHHWLNGRGFGWTPGVGDGQGGLACCSLWGCKQSDTTERLNWTELNWSTELNWRRALTSDFFPKIPLAATQSLDCKRAGSSWQSKYSHPGQRWWLWGTMNRLGMHLRSRTERTVDGLDGDGAGKQESRMTNRCLTQGTEICGYHLPWWGRLEKKWVQRRKNGYISR